MAGYEIEPARLGYPEEAIKSPGLAAAFSFLFSGFGQIYNGQFGKAAVFILLQLLNLFLMLMFILFSVIAFLVVWIWGMADAFEVAKKINASHEQGIKKCPFCGETMEIETRVCRFCGHNFPTESGTFAISPPPPLTLDEIYAKREAALKKGLNVIE